MSTPYLIVDDPVGIYLRVPFGIQDDRLIGSEIRGVHHPVIRAHVVFVVGAVAVEVLLAGITDSGSWERGRNTTENTFINIFNNSINIFDNSWTTTHGSSADGMYS